MSVIPNLNPGPAPAVETPDGITRPPITSFSFVDNLFDYGTFLQQAPDRIGTIPDPQTTVAIVGAGVAGMVAAYELLRAGLKPQVLDIYESSDRIGGRTYSARFSGVQSSRYIAELGAMRFPPTEVGLFYYLNKFQIPWVDDFPDPGRVNTVLGYQGAQYAWAKGTNVPKEFARVRDGFAAFQADGWTDNDGVHYRSPSQMRIWLANPLSYRLAQDTWQRYLDRFENVSFYDGCVTLFTSNNPPGGVAWTMPDDFEKFGALGVGSGGFGPLYELGFLEIVRLLVNGLESNQQFVPSGIQKLVDELGATRWGSYVLRDRVKLNTKVIGVDYVGGLPLIRYRSPGGQLGSRPYEHVIVATTHRAMQIDTQLTTADTLAKSIVTREQYEALNMTHQVSSGKVFMLIPEKFWVNTNLPQTVITDTLVRGLYCLDYDETKPDGPGVVLLSYTWEDDAIKQLALDDVKSRVQRLVEDVRITAPEIADYLVPIDDDFKENVRLIDWDQPRFYPTRAVVPGYYGAFKLNFPGDDHYSRALFFQFQEACAPGGRRIYLCGDSTSFTGGWAEGAIQTALNAVCGVIRAAGGTFEPMRNPVDNMNSRAYSYNTTVPETVVPETVVPEKV